MDHPQPQGPLQLIASAQGNLADSFDFIQRRLCLRHNLTPHQTGADKALATLEQLHAQFILQTSNGHAQGGLTDRATLGSPAEIVFLGKRHNVTKLRQGHTFPSWHPGYRVRLWVL